ncbi:uncharacterized protein ccdc142 isoform X1 [Denticeps clupeoides]|uniref:uncharacterized protein ccdc142 isoform X1 n=1 Tax=Denticeps clupeoides TaxID=299321 RepID=UPI0010A461C7|nr:coiled-coil domain-containing protein 142 isoform X1 [Denticeps clupeoides]
MARRIAQPGKEGSEQPAGSWYQGSFTKVESVLLSHINPGLQRLLGQKASESEDAFGVCLSSHHQQLELARLAINQQYLVLQMPGQGLLPCFCIKDISSYLSTSNDPYHNLLIPTFAPHIAQLQRKLEYRALLLLQNEFAQRSHVASNFCISLATLLEHKHLLLVNNACDLRLQNLCQQLRLHLGHWEALCAKTCSDRLLCGLVSSRPKMLRVMRQTLRLLGLQSLLLMERCIHTALSSLITAHITNLSRDSIEDALASAQIFNQAVHDFQSQCAAEGWRGDQLVNCLWWKDGCPLAFPMVKLINILAESRGQLAANLFQQWATQQTELLSCPESSTLNWNYLEEDCYFQHHSNSVHDHIATPNHLQQVPSWSFDPPFGVFIQALLSSTDMLETHCLKQFRLCQGHATISMESDARATKLQQVQDGSHLDVQAQYKVMMWRTFVSASIQQFCCPPPSSIMVGLNQWTLHSVFLLVTWVRQATKEGLIPADCKEAMDHFTSWLLSYVVFMHWDEVMCDFLGSGLKDKCLSRAAQSASTVWTITTEKLLQLFPPIYLLLEKLQACITSDVDCFSAGGSKELCRSTFLDTLSRCVVSVQSSTFWIMTKAYQFLSSWALSRFLLVTLRDLVVVTASVENLLKKVEVLIYDGETVITQLIQLRQCLNELQTFSDLVLHIFSVDCKKMSVEIFQQTMPSAKHWRVNYRTELPSSPSEYATSAAQSVLGQVLEGIRPLPEEAWLPALTEAMTAFMEAWMEHILKQKIKFSLQGALQLKQDFNLIRDLILSEDYHLSEELLQRILSLRVFQQMDAAILCLLQQPYMPSQAWDPFHHCCPSSAQDQDMGSLNSLETVELQGAQPEILSSVVPGSYLPVVQQEWLDLRIHSGARWRFPSLQCFRKAEP